MISIDEKARRQSAYDEFNKLYEPGQHADGRPLVMGAEGNFILEGSIDCAITAYLESAKSSEGDALDAIKNGLAEARQAFAANPEDFDNELSDDDIVAIIHMKVYPYLRTPAQVSGDDIERVTDAVRSAWETDNVCEINGERYYMIMKAEMLNLIAKAAIKALTGKEA